MKTSLPKKNSLDIDFFSLLYFSLTYCLLTILIHFEVNFDVPYFLFISVLFD